MKRSTLDSFSMMLALGLLLMASPTLAQTEYTGNTSGGAFYRIIVPDGWTPAGGLAIWNHGFDLEPIDPLDDEDMGPFLQVQLAQGYAVAASSYSLVGWALFETVQDLEDLYAVFVDEVGVPQQVIVHGASLGGIVTAQAIEEANLGNVVGALPICGAVAGSRLWDGAFDLRQLYDAVCGDVPGGEIPGGFTGLSFPPTLTDIFSPINVCTGILLDAGLRSPEQADRLAKLLALSQLPENFLLTDMGFATFGMADLIFDPRKMGGANPLTNEDVVYGDAAIDASIARLPVNQDARKEFFDNYTPRGQVGDVKIVSIHTDKDGLVLAEAQSEYAKVVPDDNLSVGIVVEDIPTHCGFSEAEAVAAWETLRGWIAGFPQPTAADLQLACLGVEASGLFAGPCRYDPGFMVPDLSARVRPRAACTPGQNTLCLGEDDRFAAHVAWQDFAGGTGMGNDAGFTTDDTGSFWFFDPGNIEMVIKSIDGRADNGHFWLFFGSLTNVSFDLTVTDTVTALQKTYSNPLGNFASEGDNEAF